MKSLAVFFILLSAVLANVGCTSLYYLPNRTDYTFVKAEARPPQDIYFNSTDGTRLYAWHFDAENKCSHPKALILHFHGNAQNLSSHYKLLHWLTAECYEYSIFDYRAYGKSEGPKSAAGILSDARTALKHFSEVARSKNLPLIVYGQSIGGTLLLRSLQLEEKPSNLKAVIVESSFYKYTQIGREKLSEFWLTWPFQGLTYLLVSNHSSPGGRDFSILNGTPTLLIYSTDDPVIPIHHGHQLYEELPEPKWFWSHPHPGHINSMFVESGIYRKQLVQWLTWIDGL